MKSFTLIIITPSKKAFDGNAIQLSLRMSDGDRAIMAGHIPFTGAIGAGKCKIYQPDGNIREAKITNGILSVEKGRVLVLSSEFIWNKSDQ